jgi:vitamin K-dependent gamma-carboxylase
VTAEAASLAVFRVSWGLLMAAHILSYLTSGRINRQYVDPAVHFHYPGFAWVAPLPEVPMKLLFFGLLLASLGVAAGWFYRFCAGFFFVGITYLLLADAGFYQNHFYLICLIAFWVWVLPLDRASTPALPSLTSLDARRRPGLALENLPAWMLWMLRFHLALPYFFGGVAKLNADWLLRAQPLRIWLAEGFDKHLAFDVLSRRELAFGMAWASALFDLSIVPLLLWKRTRVVAMFAALLFHAINHTLFDIGIFPFFMTAGSLLFFEPDWPRRLAEWWGGRQARGARPAAARASKKKSAPVAALPLAAASPWVIRLTIAYVAIQLLLPLRHFAIPGNVDWTDEGHRFAWRMKLRDKRGDLRFVAYDPAKREETLLSNTSLLLNPLQHTMMGHDPDFMRQFAHHLKRQLQAGGWPADVRVRVRCEIAFNGRPVVEQVDPTVDLSEEPWRWGAAPWIRLPAPPPPPTP